MSSNSYQNKVELAIIGGSGLYQMEALEKLETIDIETPYGPSSDSIIIGRLSGKLVAFLARHGQGHVYSPSEINYRANIAALKILGVKSILSVSAVGSLKEDIEPGDFVLVDQFIDKTYQRQSSFFGNGIVAHVSFAKPTCENLRKQIKTYGQVEATKIHGQGIYVCMEGPAFSSQAESKWHQQIGADVIGMTNVTEAKLAREAEICYATIALATDYDCWHEGHAHVTTDMILETLKNNIRNVQKYLSAIISNFSDLAECRCKKSLKNALLTRKDHVKSERLLELNFLLPRDY